MDWRSGPQGEVSDLLAEIEAGLERDFRSKPVAIALAMKDLAFTEALGRAPFHLVGWNVLHVGGDVVSGQALTCSANRPR
jgi:hypothetical protein